MHAAADDDADFWESAGFSDPDLDYDWSLPSLKDTPRSLADLAPPSPLITGNDNVDLKASGVDTAESEPDQLETDSAVPGKLDPTPPTPRSWSLAPSSPEESAHSTELLQEYREYLTDVMQKMMFVSGETAEASAETTWLIEEIVREQVVHMVSLQPRP
jgi:hypothetical protein